MRGGFDDGLARRGAARRGAARQGAAEIEIAVHFGEMHRVGAF